MLVVQPVAVSRANMFAANPVHIELSSLSAVQLMHVVPSSHLLHVAKHHHRTAGGHVGWVLQTGTCQQVSALTQHVQSKLLIQASKHELPSQLAGSLALQAVNFKLRQPLGLGWGLLLNE